MYVACWVADSQKVRAAAASLVMPEHAVVCDRSAAWLHGVDAFDPVVLDVPPELEVVSIGGADRVLRPGVDGGKRALAPEDIMELHGIRLTTPVRTAADLGTLRGRLGAFAAMSMLARVGGFGVVELLGVVARFAGRRGVRQLRALAPLIEPLCESMAECWTLLHILDAGLPRPRPQHELWVTGWGLARLDFAWRFARVCVEYDGEEFHDDPEARERDRRRRECLRAMGWTVIVVRKADLRGAALDDWLAELRTALAPQRRRAARAPR